MFKSLVGRVWLGMGGLLALMGVIAGIGLVQSQAVETRLLSAHAEAQRLTSSGRRMHDRVTDAYLATLLATMVDDPEDLKFELDSLAKATAAYQAQFREVFDLPATEALGQRADELRRAETELAPLLDSSLKRLQRAADEAGARYQHDPAIQELVVSSLKPLFDQWLRAIDALDTTAAEASEEASRSAQAAAQWGRRAQLAIAALGLVVGLLGALGVARGLTRPVREAVAVAARVAEGDLARAVPSGGADEIGALLGSLGEMQHGLQRLVGSAREAAELIDASAGEVASGISDLSQRTELAAAELQRTAAATAQLSAGVQALADSAGSAGHVTQDATRAALAGDTAMGQAQALMGTIGRSSERIAGIVAVIDGIAFRTNILALNAAVQALEQVTQQNAALVEQGAASAAALGDQAHRLKALVSVFRFEGEVAP